MHGVLASELCAAACVYSSFADVFYPGSIPPIELCREKMPSGAALRVTDDAVPRKPGCWRRRWSGFNPWQALGGLRAASCRAENGLAQ